jgi:CBS domain-containing protein
VIVQVARNEEGTMLTVRDLMTRDVATIAPESSLREAIELLSARHVTGAPVTVGERLVGVLSASDVLAFEASTPGVPTERPALELEEEQPTEWVEGEEAPGTFFSDQWSDVGAEVLERFAEAKGPEWDYLSEHIVSEAMTPTVCSIAPFVDVYTAAENMTRAGVHRLIVMEEGRLVGILSSLDIVRAVGQRRLVAAEPLARAMRRNGKDARH